jgi:hypothetical protein
MRNELQELWSTTPGGIDIPVSATARGAELRSADPNEHLRKVLVGCAVRCGSMMIWTAEGMFIKPTLR